MSETTLEERVAAFVSSTTGLPAHKVKGTTRLAADCGLDGDDAAEFMTAFAAEFAVDLADFNFDSYFGPEGAFNPIVWLYKTIVGTKTKMLEVRVVDLVSAARAGRWENAQVP